MSMRLPAAPWPASLRIVSALATLVLVGTTWILWRTVPRGTRVPFAETFAHLLVFVPVVVLVLALTWVVTGYELDRGEMRVGRLLSTTRVPLEGLSAAWHSPDAMCRSIRVFGNGGLYSVTGLYRNAALGTYRAFVTDPKKAVVLRLPKRPVVVSPADPAAFLATLRTLHPEVPQGPASAVHPRP